MRAFLLSILVIIVLALGSLFVLNAAQRTSTSAYSSDGARVDMRWSTRRVAKRAGSVKTGEGLQPGQMAVGGESGECEVASALAWLAVDFGDAANDNPGCA